MIRSGSEVFRCSVLDCSFSLLFSVNVNQFQMSCDELQNYSTDFARGRKSSDLLSDILARIFSIGYLCSDLLVYHNVYLTYDKLLILRYERTAMICR